MGKGQVTMNLKNDACEGIQWDLKNHECELQVKWLFPDLGEFCPEGRTHRPLVLITVRCGWHRAMQHYMPMEKHAEKKSLDLESCIESIMPKHLLVKCRRGGCTESQPGAVSTSLTHGPDSVGTRTPSMTS
mmetsp:Transcript_96859/g.313110  ORF Transcript_96859/g.313110 Transcript_96859/m.313110 type:complete len:131 (+) Transcript_96859:170-562(+)